MANGAVIGVAVCQVAAPKQLRKSVIGGQFGRSDKGRRECAVETDHTLDAQALPT
jgi:hypothetical protein